MADGLGVNSTALLIGLSRADVRPDLILFADTRSEKPETYAYLDVRRQWLRRVGFPDLIVIRRRGVRVPDQSLEDQCLRTGTRPSLWRQELQPEMEGRAPRQVLQPVAAGPAVLAIQAPCHQSDRLRRWPVRRPACQRIPRPEVSLLVSAVRVRAGPGGVHRPDPI
jgi:hypothetical protein